MYVRMLVLFLRCELCLFLNSSRPDDGDVLRSIRRVLAPVFRTFAEQSRHGQMSTTIAGWRKWPDAASFEIHQIYV